MIDQGWLDKVYRDSRNREIQQFTTETGIRVELLPAPEAAVDQLALWRKLFANRSDTPDVYAVDDIWQGILADDLIDLKPYLSPQELAAFLPQSLANDFVNGKLVALPYEIGNGMLFYRTDLLRKYGYRSPPATWDDLYRMAATIQAGERAKGKKNFWGFVWQGAASEALTCNALEWQASEGGGQIIEPDRTISVNNPDTIHAWKRAARWVGSISPPAVTNYKEWDSFNIWESGEAAFMRNWTVAYVVSQSDVSAVKGRFDFTVLPRGRAGHATNGGPLNYGVSRYARHPQEAVKLVLYLCRHDVQLRRAPLMCETPTITDLFNDLALAKANPCFAKVKDAYEKWVVPRPSRVTGRLYPDVSRAYYEAVHSVLTGNKRAAEAAADLEAKLVQITGFKTKPPGGVPRNEPSEHSLGPDPTPASSNAQRAATRH
jgi:trehalose/maltose transport system substrate-binding protein